ncbi:DegV family protein [Lachnospiraceae bacterium KM106-2]|nr:DegV family protein [Lachnospiraceae bacterium KM106-2]
MTYRIIGDSCTDLTDNLLKDEHIKVVPLSIEIDGYRIEDDETFDQADFLRRVAESPNCPKSSCPAPETYMNLFDIEGDVYVVTLSSNLSGSYNSAMLAKQLYEEEHPDAHVAVIDSCSASVGQTIIVMKIKELAESGLPFEQVVEQATKYRDEVTTKFVLESLDTLRKNGRLSNLSAMIANVLNIKPIMGSTPEGQIIKLDQARGINKALTIMAEYVKKDAFDVQNRILGIAHCNNYERALYIKEEILKRVPFKDCIITDTAGISSLYANDGGIVIAY